MNRFVQLIEVFYCVYANIKFKGRVGYERDFHLILYDTIRLPCGLKVLGNFNITIYNKKFTLWAKNVFGEQNKGEERLIELDIRQITDSSHCMKFQNIVNKKSHLTIINNDDLNGRNKLAIFLDHTDKWFDDSIFKYDTINFISNAYLLIKYNDTNSIISALTKG